MKHNAHTGCSGKSCMQSCKKVDASSNSSCSSSSCGCPLKNATGYTITFTDGASHFCRLLASIEINSQVYVVLLHPTTGEQILYRHNETDGTVYFDTIQGEEFDIVAKTYQAIITTT